MNKIASFALALAFSTTLTAQDHAHHWFADFDLAAAKAKKEGKDLLVDFTGSDWCGWCIKLDEEVFAHKEFLDGIEKNFILVALDFPNGDAAKAKVPNPKRNEELQAKYKVGGFPTILLMSAEGEVFAKTGYQPGGPGKYLASITEMSKKGKASLTASKTIVADYAAAKGKAKSAILSQAIATLKGMEAGAIGIGSFAKVVKAGTSSKDPALQIAAVKALFSSGQHDAEVVAIAQKLDPKNKSGLQDFLVMGMMKSVTDKASAIAFMDALDELIILGAKDQKIFEAMLARAAAWAHRPMNDLERAKAFADLLEEHAADVELHRDLLDKIRK